MTKRFWTRDAFTRPATRPLRKAAHRTRLHLEALEDRTVLSTFTVLNTLNDGVGSLRWAVEQANSSVEADTIDFDSGVFSSPQTITLTGGRQLTLSDAATTTITGPGEDLLSISGNNEVQVFAVNTGAWGDLSGLTVTGGRAFAGGGLGNGGTLALTDCTVSGNSAISSGAGLQNFGTATLTDCTVSGNSGGSLDNRGTLALTDCNVSGNSGGNGLFNRGTLTLTNSTVSGNSASSGGGLYNGFGGTAALTNSTVSGNSASSYGGGLWNIGGTLSLTNSTVSGNSASHGGGGLMNVLGTATLTDCTVSGNSASGLGGGGLFNYYGTLALTNTIVAGQTGGGDIQGAVSGSNNLIGTGGSGGLIDGVNGNIVGVADPGLAPLGDYGGPTQTMPPLPGSPALDAGTSGAGIPATDQRGLGRVGAVDIGAVERQAPTITVPGDQTAYEDVDLLLSGISLSSDPQGDTPFTLTLAVDHGTLTLANTSGLTVIGNGSGSVSLSGSVADINAALAGLVYRGDLNDSGPDTLNLVADDGNRTTLASVGIDVKSAAEQAADLQAQVSALGLNQGQANSLIVKLNLQGNDGDSGKVQAFLNEVAAYLDAGILTQAQADDLLLRGNLLVLGVRRP